MLPKSSRLEGFYKKPLLDRANAVASWADLNQTDYAALGNGGLNPDMADRLIENAIGLYSLPMGVATNFVVNGKEYLIPMVIEEPSVVAACSFAAKLARAGGGFTAWADEPIMIAQIQVLDVPNLDLAAERIMACQQDLRRQADVAHPNLVARGGGTRNVEVRILRETAAGPMLVVHLLIDVRDAMGANIVNTAAEALAPSIEALTGGRVLLRILSNLTDQRLAGARCTIPLAELKTDMLEGAAVAEGVVAAWALADADPYRAATHNKGVMNGIDAVLLATGNDWRAIEAGAHAYAVRDCRYASLTKWHVHMPGGNGHNNNRAPKSPKPNSQPQTGVAETLLQLRDVPALVGEITLPMAIGTVGGTTKVHPSARAAMKILGVQSAQELAGVIAAVGLAQNFSAIRALATEGIQKGHMRLHARKSLVARQ
jgi:hydroxymethylglutaryl-CoA reductase